MPKRYLSDKQKGYVQAPDGSLIFIGGRGNLQIDGAKVFLGGDGYVSIGKSDPPPTTLFNEGGTGVIQVDGTRVYVGGGRGDVEIGQGQRAFLGGGTGGNFAAREPSPKRVLPVPTELALLVNGSTSPPGVVTGQEMVVMGTLTIASGVGVGGETVNLSAQLGAETFDLGTATLTPTASPSVFGYLATFTAGLMPFGTTGEYSFSASYAGDAANDPSTSNAVPIMVTIS